MQRRTFLLAAGTIPLAGAAADRPRILLETPLGAITIEADPARAPRSSGAFLAVVRQGGYAGGSFFRAVRASEDPNRRHPISVVQAQASAAACKSAPTIPHESTALTGLRHLRGTVSLPRDARIGTATGAGFFVCLADAPALDAGPDGRNPDGQGFAAFGRVVSGLDLVDRIQALDTHGHSDDRVTAGEILTHPVPILSARIVSAPA